MFPVALAILARSMLMMLSTVQAWGSFSNGEASHIIYPTPTLLDPTLPDWRVESGPQQAIFARRMLMTTDRLRTQGYGESFTGGNQAIRRADPQRGA